MILQVGNFTTSGNLEYLFGLETLCSDRDKFTRCELLARDAADILAHCEKAPLFIRLRAIGLGVGVASIGHVAHNLLLVLHCEHLGNELLAFVGGKCLGLHYDQVRIIVFRRLAPILFNGLLE